MTNRNDTLGSVPKITPDRDEIASYQRDNSRGLASRLGEVPHVESNGSSTTVKAILIFATLAVLVTLAWSMLLQKQVAAAEKMLNQYELRIGSLEQQLSVTDESMSESSVAMKVKIREMDGEIRKLWDNVWRKSKQRLGEHDKKLTQHAALLASTQKQLSSNDAVVKKFSAQLNGTRQLQTTVSSNQKRIASQESSLENNSDKLNRLSNDLVNLNHRVKESESWVDSINGFRRQVNRDISALKQELGSKQTGP